MNLTRWIKIVFITDDDAVVALTDQWLETYQSEDGQDGCNTRCANSNWQTPVLQPVILQQQVVQPANQNNAMRMNIPSTDETPLNYLGYTFGHCQKFEI